MPRARLDGSPPAPPRKQKLTSLTVQRLKPQSGAYLVWDLLQRGLSVNVQPSGFKSYKVIYSRQGRPRWVHIAACDAVGLSDARKLAAGIMLDVAMGKDPAAERRAARSTGTFEELATSYVEQYAKKHNKSWKQANKLVTARLLPKWAKLRAADIQRSDVRAMMASIDAPVTANQALASASAIFSWAIKQEVGGVTVNPCHGVERNQTTSRERVLSDSELPLFWQAFDSAGLSRSVALRCILLLGQRPGEVSAMRLEHVIDRWWQMPGLPTPVWPGTKNGESHRVWLSEPVRALIAELGHTDSHGVVFERLGSLDSAMRDICKALGVERATPHDLRRTCLSTITGLGFGREAMDRIANHKTKSVTDVYDRASYTAPDRRIMEAVGSHIMALATGNEPSNNVVPMVAAE